MSTSRKSSKRAKALTHDWPTIYRKRETKVSFHNPGSVCYRNSVMVLLLHTPIVRNWLQNYKCKARHGKNDPCFLCGFLALFRSYWSEKSQNSRESDLKYLWENTLRKGWIVAGKQVTNRDDQDVCEFLDRVFAVLGEECETLKYPMLNVFDFAIDKNRVCTNAGCTFSTTPKPDDHRIFTCYLQDGVDADVQDLIGNCLEDEQATMQCDTCQSATMFRSFIHFPPEILLVQVQRANMQLQKLFNSVNFDEELTINLSGDGDTRYELYAAVFHWGDNVHVGHYTVAVKGPSGKWTFVNDNNQVSPTDFQGVQAAKYLQNVALLAYRKTGTAPGTAKKSKASPPSKPQAAGTDESGEANTPQNTSQPMVLDANFEMDGIEWTFTQRIAPALTNGAQLLAASSQAAKVRLRMTEFTGEALEGLATIELRRATPRTRSKSRSKSPLKVVTGRVSKSPPPPTALPPRASSLPAPEELRKGEATFLKELR